MFTLQALPVGEASSPPHSRYRVGVTPTKRGRVDRRSSTGKPEEPTPGKRQAPMSWAPRLKRVFSIDLDTCTACDDVEAGRALGQRSAGDAGAKPLSGLARSGWGVALAISRCASGANS